MIDKNIVIAVSMRTKWSVPWDFLAVLGKKIVRTLWSTGKVVMAAFPPGIASHERKMYVCPISAKNSKFYRLHEFPQVR